MNATEHLLVCLAEECAKVIHCATKALRFGLHEVQSNQPLTSPLTNAERLVVEIVDLLAIIDMLVERGFLPEMIAVDEIDLRRKKAKVEKFMHYAEQVGTLQGTKG